ncbi:Retinoic acid receptor responder protein 3 [Liparis tanakae]|uniref:Retinoic acid receptor responder protein 3 n=1 Tax=Liparis tanakae TaxID=230148 RepID=A0A4Z2EYI7_9TELE|nr:Retinoic acid receptor responder protein 3 [Liparis tanakae]
MAPTLFEHGAKPGDLIEFSRGLYQHWAVYIGGDEVVHLTTPGGDSGSIGNMSVALSSEGQVMRDKIWEVVGDDPFEINNLLDYKYEPRERHLIVRDACRMVGSVWRYGVFSLNCEHFATELRYGKPEDDVTDSAQSISYCLVRNAEIGGAVILGVGLAVGVAALFASFLKNNDKEEEEEAREKKHKKHRNRQRHQNWQ